MNEWISVTVALPEKPVLVLAYCSDLRHQQTVIYTKGHDVEVDNEDDDGDFNSNPDKGTLTLKEGWYQECEQRADIYDYVWFRRTVTHWRHLDPSPKS